MSQMESETTANKLSASSSPQPINTTEITKSYQNKKVKKRDTHFLCLPLVTPTSIPQLSASLSHFRKLTTPPSHTTASSYEDDSDNEYDYDHQDSKLQIIASEAHRPPGTFHLTLGVMDLSRQEDMDRAMRLLQEIDYEGILAGLSGDDESTSHAVEEHSYSVNQSSDGVDTTQPLKSLTRPISPPHTQVKVQQPSTPPLKITLQGLATFPNPRSSQVFYAKPIDLTSRLQQFSIFIRQRFREVGLITETRALTLHATVANLRYAVQSRGGGRGKGGSSWRDEGQVDARGLIEVMNLRNGRIGGAQGESQGENQDGSENKSETESEGEFVWARDILIDRVAICRLGAVESDDEVLGLVYPPVGEKLFGQHV